MSAHLYTQDAFHIRIKSAVTVIFEAQLWLPMGFGPTADRGMGAYTFAQALVNRFPPSVRGQSKEQRETVCIKGISLP